MDEHTIEVVSSVLVGAELMVDALEMLSSVKLCDFLGLIRNNMHKLFLDFLEIIGGDFKAVARDVLVFIVSLQLSIYIYLHQDVILVCFSKIILS